MCEVTNALAKSHKRASANYNVTMRYVYNNALRCDKPPTNNVNTKVIGI